ncbi:hypothetical protein MRY88_10065 [Bacillus cereus]|uniref:Uncharacterized protein n=1 Tax=Bacillus cereus (strain 03BB102) TaxID=572264 RepID=A0A158RHD2_BACC3|nr:hypothetical protein [Bacillus cereus]ACO26420.1 hypothetical protein BCA_2079 [Bacillus cereus 03BB102]AJG51371.1 hypothetical protein AS54_2099 [Bacillus cereus 03BB102]QPR83171.1 hypothetical protein I6G75_27170 [Bacillus cereus]
MIYITFLAIFILIIIGLIKQLKTLNRLQNDIEFLYEFNNNFVSYLDNYRGKTNDAEENQLYVYLISNSPKVQKLLGNLGEFYYQPAFSNYIVRNYQLIDNVVASLRSHNDIDSVLSKPMLSEEFQMVNNQLLRALSNYEELFQLLKKEIKNPIILLREGVQFIVTLPIKTLYWSGLIQYTTLSKFSNNKAFKLFNSFITFIGLISSIITVTTGWEPFKKLLNNLF